MADYDMALALGRALRPQYLPAELPPPWANPKEFTMASNFVQGPGVDFDQSRSTPTWLWAPQQHYVCPKRLYGASLFDSVAPANSPSAGLGSWENFSLNGGTCGTFTFIDPDVAITGQSFKLESGQNFTAIAGLRRTVPTPVTIDRFSMCLVVRTNKGYAWVTSISPNPEDAAYVILTNNEGASLVTRYYQLHGEILCGDVTDPVNPGLAWRLFAGHIDDFFLEVWPEAKKLGTNSYDVTVRAGTTLVGRWTGALPVNYIGLGNNKLQFHQVGGLWNWRKFDVHTYNIGTTQNAAPLVLCSMPHTVSDTINSAQITVHLGETSGDLKLGLPDCRLNTDLVIWASSDDGVNWTQILMTMVAAVGKDTIDPTKTAYILGGRGPISVPGRVMRWAVEYKNEYFGLLQGVQMLGFP